MAHSVSRRVVLQVVGAGAATAGASACSRGSQEYIIPYVNQPPEVTPAVPSWYATVTARNGYGVGILAESHEGRPTKLEGNPRHPASLGALGTLDDVARLARPISTPSGSVLCLAGCIIGRALYEGRIDLAAAVAVARKSGRE